VTCGIEQLDETTTLPIAHGHAVNTGSIPVLVSPQISFNNREGQQIANIGTDSPGALLPGHSWNWTATDPMLSIPKGVSDTRVARCVASVLVSTAN